MPLPECWSALIDYHGSCEWWGVFLAQWLKQKKFMMNTDLSKEVPDNTETRYFFKLQKELHFV